MMAERAVSRRFEVLAVLALLSLTFLVRVVYLEADPPHDLSVSTDVYTDPAQYTLFARNYVQSGDFDPFDDHRRVVFRKSAVTALTVPVFELLGVNRWASRFVGLMLAFGALVLFYLFLRKTAGVVPALLFLLMTAFNYNLLFYGRLPFLEHAMTFCAFLALALVGYCQRPYWFILAGFFLGVAIFFGKAMGLVFLFPFGVLFVYQMLQRRPTSVTSVLPSLMFSLGFVAVMIFWYFFTYSPMQAQVAGYFGEQAYSLYGAPEGLQSVDDFIWKMVSLGENNRMFARMPIAGMLASVFVGIVAFHVARWCTGKSGFGAYNAGHLFMAAMIVAFYGSLMIWNYRPLRYQLVLIYPLYGGAAVVLSSMWHRWREGGREKVPYLFYVFGIPLVHVPIYQVWRGLAEKYGWSTYWDDKYWALLVSILMVILIGQYVRFKPWRSWPGWPRLAKAVVVLILGAALTTGLLDYYHWWQRPTFTAADNSRDLGLALSRGAVVSGPYAPSLVTDNDLGCVIHMFGVSQADPELFSRFPITHLLLDESNEKRARADYPDLMDSASHVLTYHIGPKKVRLFRIAGLTGHPTAEEYELSFLEQAIDLYQQNRFSEGNLPAGRAIKEHEHNLSAHLSVATVAAKHAQLDLAESEYKKAIEFSPTNYDLNATLAEFYKERYAISGNERYKQMGLKYFAEAIRLAPGVSKLIAHYRELEEKQAWELRQDTTTSSQP